MGAIANTRDVLDAILNDTRRYKSKLDEIKFDVAQKIFSEDTAFMRDVTSLQAEHEKFLADKRQETERLRQEVKRKKSATEQAIKELADELRRTRL